MPKKIFRNFEGKGRYKVLKICKGEKDLTHKSTFQSISFCLHLSELPSQTTLALPLTLSR